MTRDYLSLVDLESESHCIDNVLSPSFCSEPTNAEVRVHREYDRGDEQNRSGQAQASHHVPPDGNNILDIVQGTEDVCAQVYDW
jgi:hypothetical protein